jgi:hypothetical protein
VRKTGKKDGPWMENEPLRHAGRPVYTIVIRAEKGVADPLRNLRLALKFLLRRFQFRCVSIEPTPEDGGQR